MWHESGTTALHQASNASQGEDVGSQGGGPGDATPTTSVVPNVRKAPSGGGSMLEVVTGYIGSLSNIWYHRFFDMDPDCLDFGSLKLTILELIRKVNHPLAANLELFRMLVANKDRPDFNPSVGTHDTVADVLDGDKWVVLSPGGPHRAEDLKPLDEQEAKTLRQELPKYNQGPRPSDYVVVAIFGAPERLWDHPFDHFGVSHLSN